MNRICRAAIVVAVLGAGWHPLPTVADGLIFALPADGTWAEFAVTIKATAKFTFPEDILAGMDAANKAKVDEFSRPQTLHDTVRVSSVGVDEYGNQPCRWIELRLNGLPQDTNNDANQVKSNYVLKLLVPERYLVRGQDPLDNSDLTFFNPKETDKRGVKYEPGFDRICYEIDRFRPTFPPPLTNEERSPSETIETPAGTFRDCEVIRGTTHFDRPTASGCRWESTENWSIALHPDAPFGVVQLKSRCSGTEVSIGNTATIDAERELTLSAKGNDAATELPEGQRHRAHVPHAP